MTWKDFGAMMEPARDDENTAAENVDEKRVWNQSGFRYFLIVLAAIIAALVLVVVFRDEPEVTVTGADIKAPEAADHSLTPTHTDTATHTPSSASTTVKEDIPPGAGVTLHVTEPLPTRHAEIHRERTMRPHIAHGNADRAEPVSRNEQVEVYDDDIAGVVDAFAAIAGESDPIYRKELLNQYGTAQFIASLNDQGDVIGYGEVLGVIATHELSEDAHDVIVLIDQDGLRRSVVINAQKVDDMWKIGGVS